MSKSDLYLAAMDSNEALTLADLRALGVRKSSFEKAKARLEELREQGLVDSFYRRGQTYYRLTDAGKEYINKSR